MAKKLKQQEGKHCHIGTFSFDEVSIERLNKLMIWLHDSNSSRVLRRLIDKEYLNQAEMRGVDV